MPLAYRGQIAKNMSGEGIRTLELGLLTSQVQHRQDPISLLLQQRPYFRGAKKNLSGGLWIERRISAYSGCAMMPGNHLGLIEFP